MRTKTLLIAAALAAGLISSKAQVTSANIVGYVNLNVPNGFSLLVNPLSASGSDVATNVFSVIPDNTVFLLWTGAGYSYYDYDTTLGLNGDGSPWYDQNLNEASVPSFNVGEGFFVSPGSATVWKQVLPSN